MCLDDIGDGIESGAEWLDNWGEEHLGLPGIFTDFTSYDGDYRDGSGRVDLSDMIGGHALKPLNVAPGSFAHVQFEDVVRHMESADEDVAAGHGAIWEDIANDMAEAVNAYNEFINGFRNSPNNWQGEAADAAMTNIAASLRQLEGATKSAAAMVHLSPAFAETIRNVVREVVSRKSDYEDDMNAWPEHRAEIKREYDALAQSVMSDYATNIAQIVSQNPDMTGGESTPNHPGPAAPGHGQPDFGGGAGGASGGAPSSGAGKPNFEGLQKTTSPLDFQSPGQTSPQGAGTPQMPSLPTDALGGAADAAKDAAQKATDAAKQAMDQALGSLDDIGKQPSGVPEGVLGLGPNGLNGVPRGGAANGTGKGGGPLGAPAAKPGGAPASAAGKSPTSMPVNASRAGLGSAAGTPGAGAPAAGQRGGGADGKEHKASKALRRRSNGEDVMGKTDAVVAVVGENSADPPPQVAPRPASK